MSSEVYLDIQKPQKVTFGPDSRDWSWSRIQRFLLYLAIPAALRVAHPPSSAQPTGTHNCIFAQWSAKRNAQNGKRERERKNWRSPRLPQSHPGESAAPPTPKSDRRRRRHHHYNYCKVIPLAESSSQFVQSRSFLCQSILSKI